MSTLVVVHNKADWPLTLPDVGSSFRVTGNAPFVVGQYMEGANNYGEDPT